MTTTQSDNQTTEERVALGNMTTRPTEKVLRETLSVRQLSGLLTDLKTFKAKVISEGLNMSVEIIDDDIWSMEQRIKDKEKEGA